MSWIQKKKEKSDSELCLKCMECCKILVMPLAYRAEDKGMISFYQTRGHKIEFFNDIPYIIFKEICPYLDLSSGCIIYENRPGWCIKYDGRFDPFIREKCLWNKRRL